MAYEQRDNSGTLFRNDRKEKDSHPNATGKAMIGGIMYYINAWTKDGAKGKFQSLSFKPVDDTQERREQVVRETRVGAPVDDDLDQIPF